MEPITATVDDLWCRAAELHAAGCEAEAAGELQRILALTGDPQAAYALAVARIKAGDDLDDVRALLMAARARAPRDIDIALLLAAIDVQTGRDQHALVVLEPHADSPDPNPEALYLLAAAHMRLGHHATALALVDGALAIRYGHAGQHYLALLARLTAPFRGDDGHRERRREHVAWLEYNAPHLLADEVLRDAVFEAE